MFFISQHKQSDYNIQCILKRVFYFKLYYIYNIILYTVLQIILCLELFRLSIMTRWCIDAESNISESILFDTTNVSTNHYSCVTAGMAALCSQTPSSWSMVVTMATTLSVTHLSLTQVRQEGACPPGGGTFLLLGTCLLSGPGTYHLCCMSLNVSHPNNNV